VPSYHRVSLHGRGRCAAMAESLNYGGRPVPPLSALITFLDRRTTVSRIFGFARSARDPAAASSPDRGLMPATPGSDLAAGKAEVTA
jgi:hypothetical protein